MKLITSLITLLSICNFTCSSKVTQSSTISSTTRRSSWTRPHLNINLHSKFKQVINPIFLDRSYEDTLKNIEEGTVLLDVRPRLMWGWQEHFTGYCGEGSLQSVALYYGNYISQGNVLSREELYLYKTKYWPFTLDFNDDIYAYEYALTYEKWDVKTEVPQKGEFLDWLRDMLDNGNPVITSFYTKGDVGTVDDDFDHIMPIIGYSVDKNDEIDGIYYIALIDDAVRYTPIDFAFQTRKECYSPKKAAVPVTFCVPRDRIYAIAITGVANPNSIQARLYMDYFDDNIHWQISPHDGVHAPPIDIAGHVIAFGLSKGKKYSCVRFDNTASLPDDNKYLKSKDYSKRYDFVAQGSSHKFRVEDMKSNGNYYFRCDKNTYENNGDDDDDDE